MASRIAQRAARKLVKDSSGPLVSVIIPTMNEPLIAPLVDRVRQALLFVKHEVIVVDKSDTPPELTGVRIVTQRSRGLGRAILEGLEVARGEWVSIMDGDFSHRPEDLARLVRKIHSADFVLGSRYVEGGKNLDAPLRRVVSRFFNLLAKSILQLKFFDPMSGFIVAKVDVFRKVNPNPIGFKINLEVVYMASHLGFEGIEVPIVFRPRSLGKSKAGIREAIRTVSYILSLRFKA